MIPGPAADRKMQRMSLRAERSNLNDTISKSGIASE